MNKQQLLSNIQSFDWVKEIVSTPKLVEVKPNGDKWYITNVLESCDSGTTYRNIGFYVSNEGQENEEASYQGGTPATSILPPPSTDITPSANDFIGK